MLRSHETFQLSGTTFSPASSSRRCEGKQEDTLTKLTGTVTRPPQEYSIRGQLLPPNPGAPEHMLYMGPKIPCHSCTFRNGAQLHNPLLILDVAQSNTHAGSGSEKQAVNGVKASSGMPSSLQVENSSSERSLVANVRWKHRREFLNHSAPNWL